MKDLIILCADKDAKLLIEAILPRMAKSKTSGNFVFDAFVHPNKDAGVLVDAHNFLRPFHKLYRNACGF